VPDARGGGDGWPGYRTEAAGGGNAGPFNSNGDASHIITGLAPGTHTITALLTDANNDLLNRGVGYAVSVNTVTKPSAREAHRWPGSPPGQRG
jgi:hypothetical protein